MFAPFTVASFNQYLNEKKLMATHCEQCGGLYLPPRAICPQCHSDQMAWTEVGGQGRLAAFTIVYIGPSAMLAQGYDRTNPYCTGIVALDEGVKVSARIVGVDARNPAGIKIDSPVAVEFLERGEGETRQTTLAFRAL